LGLNCYALSRFALPGAFIGSLPALILLVFQALGIAAVQQSVLTSGLLIRCGFAGH